MQIISASIDLSKIDKSKIIEGKNGAKYYNFDVIVNDQPNQYGKDVSICAPQTKEERQEKIKRVYIGNGKTMFKTASNEANVEKVHQEAKQEYSSHGITTRNGITTEDSDLPF